MKRRRRKREKRKSRRNRWRGLNDTISKLIWTRNQRNSYSMRRSIIDEMQDNDDDVGVDKENDDDDYDFDSELKPVESMDIGHQS